MLLLLVQAWLYPIEIYCDHLDQGSDHGLHKLGVMATGYLPDLVVMATVYFTLHYLRKIYLFTSCGAIFLLLLVKKHTQKNKKTKNKQTNKT